jgi:hypothetical protein
MSITIAGVVKNGAVVPNAPLPDGGSGRNPAERGADRGSDGPPWPGPVAQDAA